MRPGRWSLTCRSHAEATASAKTGDRKQCGAFEQKAAAMTGSNEQREATEGPGVPPVLAGNHCRVIGGDGSGLVFSPRSVLLTGCAGRRPESGPREAGDRAGKPAGGL